MQTKSFALDETKALRENRYTAYVSPSTIRFTLEFKQHFRERLQQGASPSRIFVDAGYDIDVSGQTRIRKFTSRVREEANSPDGLHENYGTRKKHLEPSDYEHLPSDAVQAAMQKELLYLRQELEFIKKIIRTVSSERRKP